MKIGILALTLSALNLAAMEAIKKDNNLYKFSPNTLIKLNKTNEVIDISDITVNLKDISVGGIGRGADASTLLAHSMRMLGNELNVCNMPFAVEASVDGSWDKKSIVSDQGIDVDAGLLRKALEEGINQGFKYINIPIDMNGHASLATFVILDDKIEVRFYDSFGDLNNFYEKRYAGSLFNFIASLLPEHVQKPTDYTVLHLLYQGDENSTGCGYYTIYTAMLLRDDEDFRRQEATGVIWFDQHHDSRIRALLAVATMLEFGLENVNIKYEYVSQNYNRYLFEKLGFSKKALKLALEEKMKNH